MENNVLTVHSIVPSNIIAMTNPLCDLYFFDADISLAKDLRDCIERSILKYETVSNFDFVCEKRSLRFNDAVERMNNIGSRWIFYPNAVIIRYDGVILGIYLAEPLAGELGAEVIEHESVVSR